MKPELEIAHLFSDRKKVLADYELIDFFKKTADQFKKELLRLAGRIYNYNDAYHSVFELNENAWVGLFNNAIINAWTDNATTLLEFNVMDWKNENGQIIGKADLLTEWKTANGTDTGMFILFEAKKTGKTKSLNYIKKSISQTNTYLESEAEYYHGKRTYVVLLNFKPIIYDDKHAANTNTTDYHFCDLYFMPNTNDARRDNALWVYGKVFTPKEIKELSESK